MSVAMQVFFAFLAGGVIGLLLCIHTRLQELIRLLKEHAAEGTRR